MGAWYTSVYLPKYESYQEDNYLNEIFINEVTNTKLSTEKT